MITADLKNWHRYALNSYAEYVHLNTTISYKMAGRNVSFRLGWASILFSKLCVTSVSLLRLIPGNDIATTKFDNWDFPSIATLARNLIENIHTLYYLCYEKISVAEWQCRMGLFNLHDCISRKKMFLDFGLTAEEEIDFDLQANELRSKLNCNTCFIKLPENIKKKFLKGDHAFLLTREEIEQRFTDGDSNFKGMYKFLSSQAHTFPLSFYRSLEQKRGTGKESDVETGYICLTLEYIVHYLQFASQETIKLFPDIRITLNSNQRIALDKEIVSFHDHKLN